MPRQAREKSKNGTYHIMLRGINQQQIFEEGKHMGTVLCVEADVTDKE